MSTARDERPLAGRDAIELVAAQLAAIDAWCRARRDEESGAESGALSREMRLDLARRLEALRREQRALQARADEHLRASGSVLSGRAPVRAVLAHRDEWLRTAVRRRLAAQGVEVVGEYDDGADASGTVVAEQPDLVLVEDRLPTLPGVEVVRRVRAFAPGAVVVAQCLDSSGVEPLVEAGAQQVVTRKVPPADIADGLVRLLVSSRPVPVA